MKFATMAEEAQNQELRSTYLRMAQAYLRLAEHAQRSNGVFEIAGTGIAR